MITLYRVVPAFSVTSLPSGSRATLTWVPPAVTVLVPSAVWVNTCVVVDPSTRTAPCSSTTSASSLPRAPTYGEADWPQRLRLPRVRSSVDRVELSVGSADSRDWANIRALIEREGTGPQAALRRNFAILQDITQADAVNSDDEDAYHLGSAVAFARLVERTGYRHFTFAPYEKPRY
ncbi:hypothetical protein ACQPZF_17130 [Actinosynnema sp. CS-041913]|uniref:hypothetical protein n=1 Tax=Actinosynnema sp. CS-041913 TaxID=3239917 RepID=UPI003D93892B